VVTLRIDPVRLAYSPLWQIHSGARSSWRSRRAFSRSLRRARRTSAGAVVLDPAGRLLLRLRDLRLCKHFADVVRAGSTSWARSTTCPRFSFRWPNVRRAQPPLIDVGFVLNRAAVFAIVSSIVIARSSSWNGRERVARRTTHTTSAVIGWSSRSLGALHRFIHHYVDRFVIACSFASATTTKRLCAGSRTSPLHYGSRRLARARPAHGSGTHDADAAEILVRDGPATYVSGANGERKTVGENDPHRRAARMEQTGRPGAAAGLGDSREFAFR